MAIDPLSAISGIGSTLSGVFGQQGPTTVEKNLARESQNKQGAPIAAALSAKLATLPLADRAAFLLAQRFSPEVMSNQNFVPHDIFNQGSSAAVPQYNTQNQAALASANAGYRPGQGGFDPGVLKQALANLGSSHDQSYSTSAGGSTPWGADAFTPIPTAGQKAKADEAAQAKKKPAIFGGGLPSFAGR